MKQHALKTHKYLHPADVGADMIRPRATNSRPYGFYCSFFAFCNKPFINSLADQNDPLCYGRGIWVLQSGQFTTRLFASLVMRRGMPQLGQ